MGTVTADKPFMLETIRQDGTVGTRAWFTELADALEVSALWQARGQNVELVVA